MGDTVDELVARARSILFSKEPGRMELWRAYVAIECAILDLKLRSEIEGEKPPARPPKKTIDLAMARALLDHINTKTDEKKLLYDLRACRDAIKSLVAAYGRRSTMS